MTELVIKFDRRPMRLVSHSSATQRRGLGARFPDQAERRDSVLFTKVSKEKPKTNSVSQSQQAPQNRLTFSVLVRQPENCGPCECSVSNKKILNKSSARPRSAKICFRHEPFCFERISTIIMMVLIIIEYIILLWINQRILMSSFYQSENKE